MAVETLNPSFLQTLKRCYGLPLVIEVVGVSLKGRGLHLWKDQVESWSEGKIILERLQPSFNALEPHLKECFMDMGSFLEDHKIRASVIIDLWVELYGTSSSSSIVYMKYLNDLASQNLLKLVPLRYVYLYVNIVSLLPSYHVPL